MKKAKYVVFFIFAFFCLIMPTYAAKYITMVDALYIRKGPGTNYGYYKLGQAGLTLSLTNDSIIKDEGKNGACDDGWYQVDYEGSKAYVCSSYAQIYDTSASDNKKPETVCEVAMQEAGFPSSYWDGLCSLKAKHPEWTFKSIQTNLDWSSVIDKQSSCGKSLIQTSNQEYLDKSCSAYDGSFKAASQKAVAFYMDPRNFLTEKYIFQYEYLKYDKDLEKEYANAVTKIIGNAEFYKYHKNKGTDLATLIVNAGKETNVSPIFLASRIYQELGASSVLINLYGGEYIKTKPRPGEDSNNWNPKEYLGYYNFYNIGINSTCNNNYGTTYCGLNYAKNNNWQGVYNAVKGGASFLSGGYISQGQYTAYLQKYNVDPVNKNMLHTHQYMTNVQAPSSESISAYNSYSKIGLLDKAFAFYIPVYKNMNADITNSNTGANGDNYKPADPSNLEANVIITSAGLKVSKDLVSGIKLGTDISTVISSLESIAGNGNIEITSASGNKLNKGLIGTGNKIKVTNDKGTTTYEVVIKGDTSGDGQINALDLLQVQKSILGTYNLKDAYLKAADPSSDGEINALDLLQIQKNILGTYTISQ